jgi:tetratricopeptide (TPR) repeat protein
MKTLMCLVLLAAVPGGPAGGDREEGLRLYKEGRYKEAAAAFQRAVAAEPESAELHYNLALASWRSGDLTTAEVSAEKYAALDEHARPDLHAGLLGAVRHEEAVQLQATVEDPAPGEEPKDPIAGLKKALAKAKQARDYFVRGASERPNPELRRNSERTLKFIQDLERRIEELEKQAEQEPSDDEGGQQKKDEQKKDSEQSGKPKESESEDPDEHEQPGEPGQEKPKPGKQDPDSEQQTKNNTPGQERAEGSPAPEPGEGENRPEPKPEPGGEGQDRPVAEAGPQNRAPGEGAEGRELTPEQAQRLIEKLEELERQLRQLRGGAKSSRARVERDW